MNSDEKRGVERFRRVKDESVNIDDRLVDNSFEAKVSVHVARENFKFKKRGEHDESFKNYARGYTWTNSLFKFFLIRSQDTKQLFSVIICN